MGTSFFNRRDLVLAGAAALSGCASASGPASPDDTANADAAFRDLVDRLGERSRGARPFLLRRFARAPLTADGRVLYEALLAGADADAALARFPWGQSGAPYPVTHRNGAYRRAGDVRDADERESLVRELNRDTNRLEGNAALGVVPPGFAIDAALPAVEDAARRWFVDSDPWNERLADAFTRQLETLRALRSRAPAEPGMWRLPRGEDYYALALQLQLGAAVDPREAHARAAARCAELRAEADTLLRAHRLVQGSVAERLRTLRSDPRHLADTDAKKGRAVEDMNARLARTRALLAGVIDGVADAPAEIRRLDANLEQRGAQGRRVGSAYLVDLGANRPTWTLASVVHHEVIPGHILQAPYERAAQAPALQLRYAGAYSEGWAIYAEQLADELGAFDDDRLSRLGYLQWMLFRIGRVVADTGIHVMRWSRQRAVEEMRALQGDNIAFISIEDDVDRFCVQPGVYAAQGLAALDIVAVREAIRRSAREAFAMPRFHEAMLRHGPLSPSGLAQAARAAFAVP